MRGSKGSDGEEDREGGMKATAEALKRGGLAALATMAETDPAPTIAAEPFWSDFWALSAGRVPPTLQAVGEATRWPKR
jgi:hypothetical protein